MDYTRLIDSTNNAPMTDAEAEDLFSRAIAHPSLVWTANNSGCEARADMIGELAEANGLEVSKVWARPRSSDDRFYVYLNEAGTERTIWSYHVAIIATVERGAERHVMALDPSLFDRPVGIEDWTARLTQLADEYGSELEFKGSSSTYFYGPDDTLTSTYRDDALETRREVLENAGNLDDAVVLEGVLMRARGDFVDKLMRTSPQDYSRLRSQLRYLEFKNWFFMPTTRRELRSQLQHHPRYFGIDCSRIVSAIDLDAATASVELRELFWPQLGNAFEALKARAESLLNGHDDLSLSFRVIWNPEFSQEEWYSPFSEELWARYGIDVGGLGV